MKTTRRFFNLLAKDKQDLVYLYVYAGLQGLINLSLPIGIQAIMRLVLAGRLSASWTILTLIVTVGVIVTGLFQMLQLYIVEILQRKLFVRSAFEFAYRIPHFRLKSLGSSYAPEIVHRFFDVTGVQKNLNKVLLDFSSSTLQIIFGLILLSLYHPVFIAFGFALLLTLFLIIFLSSKRGLATSIQESDSKYKMAYWLTELARAMPTFKLSGSDRMALKQTDEIAQEYLNNRKKHFRVVVTQWVSILSLKTLVTAGLLIIGAVLLINNSITIGQFVASEIVIILVLNSSEKLISSLESIYDLLTSIEKLGKVTDLALDKERTEGVELPRTEALRLDVHDLSIKGVLDENPVINNLSFSLEPGQSLCVSGPSGSGKSTLLKTLSSMWDNYDGNIKVNDIPLSSIDLQAYRNATSVILNDQEIFYGSLLDNVGLQHPELTKEDTIRAIELVGLGPLVERLPNGYNEVLKNAERMLSRTERIRLITARAIANKPGLIIAEDLYSDLDEHVADELAQILVHEVPRASLVITSNHPRFKTKCSQNLNLSKHA